MNRFILLFCTLFLSFNAFAANHVIHGKAVNFSTKEPVDFADVILYAGDKHVAHVSIEGDGLFRFERIPDGEYVLQVKLLGYDPYISDLLVLSGENRTMDMGVIVLRELETGLATVEIVAQRKQVIYKLDKRIIDGAANILAGGGTAIDILENTPAVRVDADGNLTFRGSSGFKVFIDGRPSVLGGTQGLEQVPANQIENIEIITTPSARYDTDGDVGIINIITKKDFSSGFSGVVNVTGSTYGTKGLDFLFTSKRGTSRWYLGGNVLNMFRKSDFEQNKTTLINDTLTSSFSAGPRESKRYTYTGKLGWQYVLTKTHFDVELEGGYDGHSRVGDLAYFEEHSTGGVVFDTARYHSRDEYDLHETFAQTTLNFRHNFNDKGMLLSSHFFLKYGGNALEYFKSGLFNRDNQRMQGHQAWEAEHRWTVRANLDYVWPYSSTGRLETGYQYYSYLEDGDYKMEYWNPDTQDFYWRDDIYNTFYFQRGINSLYAIWAESVGSFDYQLGARGEHTHQVLRSSKEWANRIKNMMELFPSAHVGFDAGNNHRLSVAFSYRTNRPELFFMEPYITFRDYYSAEIGNPDIRPEYIRSYEVNYKKTFGVNTFAMSVFHRARKDKIERLRIPYLPGITLDSMANVGRDYSTGADANLMLSPVKWWNSSVNGSVYYYKVVNELEGGGAKQTSTNYELAWNNALDVGKNTRLQLDANFVGPSVATQGGSDSFYYFNLALRQQLLKRKLTGILAFRDVLGTAVYHSYISSPNLTSDTHIRPKTPLVTLTFSYLFNNHRQNAGQSRTSHDLFEGTNH